MSRITGIRDSKIKEKYIKKTTKEILFQWHHLCGSAVSHTFSTFVVPPLVMLVEHGKTKLGNFI